jgi:hypothetical protein
MGSRKAGISIKINQVKILSFMQVQFGTLTGHTKTIVPPC